MSANTLDEFWLIILESFSLNEVESLMLWANEMERLSNNGNKSNKL